MRISFKLGCVLGGSAALTILAGCSGGGGVAMGGQIASTRVAGQSISHAARWSAPVSAVPSGYHFVAPDAALMFGDPNPTNEKRKKSAVFAAEFTPGQVNLYALPDTKNVAPKCALTAVAVNGIGTDAKGTLYVPSGSFQRITTYAKGTCTATPVTLFETNGQPSDIAFGSDGTIYVADISSPRGPGLISVYKKGATSPSFTLTDPSIGSFAPGIAIDSSNDVFLSYRNTSGRQGFLEFKDGKMPGTVLRLSGASFVIGLTFDDVQNLVAIDYKGGAVLTYAPPYNGAPSKFFVTKGSSAYAKLDTGNKNLYVADFANGSIDVYTYPAGTYEYSITNGLTQSDMVQGVAVEPSDNN